MLFLKANLSIFAYGLIFVDENYLKGAAHILIFKNSKNLVKTSFTKTMRAFYTGQALLIRRKANVPHSFRYLCVFSASQTLNAFFSKHYFFNLSAWFRQNYWTDLLKLFFKMFIKHLAIVLSTEMHANCLLTIL